VAANGLRLVAVDDGQEGVDGIAGDQNKNAQTF